MVTCLTLNHLYNTQNCNEKTNQSENKHECYKINASKQAIKYEQAASKIKRN